MEIAFNEGVLGVNKEWQRQEKENFDNYKYNKSKITNVGHRMIFPNRHYKNVVRTNKPLEMRLSDKEYFALKRFFESGKYSYYDEESRMLISATSFDEDEWERDIVEGPLTYYAGMNIKK
jgi:hypothetical protein